LERKRAAVQLDQVLGDWQAEACALLGRLDRVRSLSKGCEHDRDLLVRNPGPGVLDTQILATRCGPADLEPDLAALRRELDGIAEKVEADLANGALIRP